MRCGCGLADCGLRCTALDALPVAIDRLDPDGTITYCNEAYAQLRGHPAARLIGRKVWEDLASEHDREAAAEFFRHIAERRPTPAPIVANSLRADGSVVNMIIDWRYVLGADGELLGYTSIVSDAARDTALRAALQQIGLVLIEQGVVSSLVPLEAADTRVPGLASLSPREREVVDLLAKGYRAPSIARRLHISPNTVRNHLKKSYQKLGVHSQEQLLDLITGRD